MQSATIDERRVKSSYESIRLNLYVVHQRLERSIGFGTGVKGPAGWQGASLVLENEDIHWSIYENCAKPQNVDFFFLRSTTVSFPTKPPATRNIRQERRIAVHPGEDTSWRLVGMRYSSEMAAAERVRCT